MHTHGVGQKYSPLCELLRLLLHSGKSLRSLVVVTQRQGRRAEKSVAVGAAYSAELHEGYLAENRAVHEATDAHVVAGRCYW